MLVVYRIRIIVSYFAARENDALYKEVAGKRLREVCVM